MDHVKRAEELFLQGYNCAQATFAAFCDVTGLEFETALRLVSGMGGGMGKLREVCGACSAMFLVLGMADGYSEAEDAQGKAHTYAQVQLLAQKFKDAHGTIICRELLEGVSTDPSPLPEARTAEYYQKRPCARYVRTAAQIIEDFLAGK